MSATILVIEDNEQNMYLTTFILEKHGYRVYQAYNGVDGVNLAVEMEPDMILLDIQLPGMDGYEVARRLRARPRLKKTPIIAVTSYAMPGDREQTLLAGCSGYIEKPINRSTPTLLSTRSGPTRRQTNKGRADGKNTDRGRPVREPLLPGSPAEERRV